MLLVLLSNLKMKKVRVKNHALILFSRNFNESCFFQFFCSRRFFIFGEIDGYEKKVLRSDKKMIDVYLHFAGRLFDVQLVKKSYHASHA